MIVEILISLLIWLFQIGMVLLSASVVPGILLLLDRRKLAKVVLAGLIMIECASISYVSICPAIVCPDEFRPYMSADIEHTLVSVNNGLYSSKVPVFPVVIKVTYADDENIIATTYYMFFGKRDTIISVDGLSQTPLK